jgi:hypothetical protein
MNITTDILTKYFQQFNHDYFADGLPLPRLVPSRSRTRLGSFSCKRKLTWRGRKLYDFTIRISTYYNMTERHMQNILLHEMIHYSIAYTGLKDTSAHGVVFRGMMDNLNRKYGWEITVTLDTRGWELSEAAQKKMERQRHSKRLILALVTHDGKYFLSVVSRRCAGEIELRILRTSDIIEHRWFESSDDYFSTFTVVRSLRGRRVSKEEYERFLPK